MDSTFRNAWRVGAMSLLVVGAAHAQRFCDDGIFPLRAPFLPSNNDGFSRALAFVELNGDGSPELVNASSNVLFVSPVNWQGPAPTQQFIVYPAGDYFQAEELAAGDIDGDGDPDVVLTANSTAGNKSLGYFRNDGGSLVAVGGVAGATFSAAVDVGDLDGDGRADVAVASLTPPEVRLLRGVASGVPVFQTALSCPSFVRGSALGDIDGDGDLDVVASCTPDGGEGSVKVFRNDGSWSFTPLATIPLPFKSKEIRVGDLNGDGRADATVIGLEPIARFARLLSNGNNLGAPQVLELPGFPSTHRLADNDGDRDLDVTIIHLGVTLGDVRVLRNLTSQGQPGEFQTWLGWMNMQARSIAIADTNGDGAAELAATDRVPTSTWGLAGGRANATFALSVLSPVPLNVGPAVLADFDRDCDSDAVVLSGNGSKATVQRCNGANGFAQVQQLDASEASPWSSPAIGEINGDGNPDFVLVRSQLGQIRRFVNNGTGVFSGLTPQVFTGLFGPIALGDVDGDGDSDAVARFSTAPFLRSLTNERGTFVAGSPLGEGGSISEFRFADVDGDGDLDLVGVGTALRVWINSGTGSFTFGSQPNNTVAAGSTLGIGDVDGDGDLDLAVRDVSLQNGTIRVLLNNGQGTFSSLPLLSTTLNASLVHAWDVDDDGLADLVVPEYAGPKVIVHRSLGAGQFAPGESYHLRSANGAIAFGHTDLDGRVDIVYAPSNATAVGVAPNALCVGSDFLIGDINHDGRVEACDLAILLGAWGTINGTPTQAQSFADMNDDGAIDGADLALLLGSWTGS